MKLLTVVVLLFFIFCYATGNDKIIIDLSIYHPSEHKYNVFSKYYDITENCTTIDINNIQNDVGFFIIQVHTYLENMTLSNSYNLTHGTYIMGTNTGLFWNSSSTSTIFYLFRNCQVDPSVKTLIIINVYDKQDPVPGGCNLSFDTEVAPYQVTSYDDNLITVKCQPPLVNDELCSNNTAQLDMYHLFLSEYDNSIETYFSGIEKMSSVDKILKYGWKVPDIGGRRKYTRIYSSYIGTGEVFAIISTYRNRRTAYVPVISYGCDLSKWRESCVGPVAIHWKFLCAVQLICGIFVCFFGHRFFRITLYIVSFTFGLMVTYFVISMEEYVSATEKTITAFTVGFIYGVIWLLVWRKFGLPCLVVHLAFLLSGFLTASLLFYTVLADISIFTNGVNYWMVFLCIMIVCLIISMTNAMYGHITSISFVGAYACVMALNYYIGGNLPYILINTYRRVAVKDFNVAVISPPLQTIDIIHVLFWVLLLLFGGFVQIRHQQGKPPFPPNRRFGELSSSETTPLLHPDIFVPPPAYTRIRQLITSSPTAPLLDPDIFVPPPAYVRHHYD